MLLYRNELMEVGIRTDGKAELYQSEEELHPERISQDGMLSILDPQSLVFCDDEDSRGDVSGTVRDRYQSHFQTSSAPLKGVGRMHTYMKTASKSSWTLGKDSVLKHVKSVMPRPPITAAISANTSKNFCQKLVLGANCPL